MVFTTQKGQMKPVHYRSTSGMRRETAADLLAGSSSAVVGQEPGRIDDTVRIFAREGRTNGGLGPGDP